MEFDKLAVEAVLGSDVVATDTWVSMGQESDGQDRQQDLVAYVLDRRAVEPCGADAIVLHCLPAYRGKEIAAEVIDGTQSVVWDEAENRRHVQKPSWPSLDERARTEPEPVPRQSSTPTGRGPSTDSDVRHDHVGTQILSKGGRARLEPTRKGQPRRPRGRPRSSPCCRPSRYGPKPNWPTCSRPTASRSTRARYPVIWSRSEQSACEVAIAI